MRVVHLRLLDRESADGTDVNIHECLGIGQSARRLACESRSLETERETGGWS
jgi:hypothetical protein